MSRPLGLLDGSKLFPLATNTCLYVNWPAGAKLLKLRLCSDKPPPSSVPFASSSRWPVRLECVGASSWKVPLRQTSVTCHPSTLPPSENGSTAVILTRQTPLNSHWSMQPSRVFAVPRLADWPSSKKPSVANRNNKFAVFFILLSFSRSLG